MNDILKKRIEEAAREYAGNQTGLDYIGESSCEQGFIDGARFSLSNQWISVEDVMPELNEEVLVLFPDGSATVALRHKTFNVFGGDAIVWRNGDYTYDDSWIKFWMPIPKFNPDKPNNP